MTINAPAGKFLVIAQLSENSSHKGANDKGHRYFVHAGYDNPLDMGRGTFCQTIEQARNRIIADKQTMAKRTDASGLIDWGSSPARDYAIFPVTFGEAVE